MQTLGALEAGGTKMVMAVFSADGTMQDRVSIPTREPETTMPEMISYLLHIMFPRSASAVLVLWI